MKRDIPSAINLSMQIHVMQEGEQFGPYSKAQLEVYLWEGNAQRSDLAWVEGTEDWLPLWQVMGLPAQPGELPEEEVVEEIEEAAPEIEEVVPVIEAAPLPVAAEAAPFQEEALPALEEEAPPALEEPVAETPPPIPEPEETPPPLPEPEAETEAPPLPVEEESPPPVDDGRPKLIIPGAAPKRKLKLNLPDS